jgi:hypothetical protein
VRADRPVTGSEICPVAELSCYRYDQYGPKLPLVGIEPFPDMRALVERLEAIEEGPNNISFKEGTSTNTGWRRRAPIS